MSFYARMSALPGAPVRLPGGSWGGSGDQTPRVTSPTASLGTASKFTTIMRSILDRFGVDLGSLLGVMLGSFWLLVGPSWSQSRLRTVFTSKKRMFTRTYVSQRFLHFFLPRWGPTRPKFAPRRVQDRLGSLFFPLDLPLRFLIVFGSPWVSFRVPKWALPNCHMLC